MRFEDFDIDFDFNKEVDKSECCKIIERVSTAKYKKNGEVFAIRIMIKPKENYDHRNYFYEPDEEYEFDYIIKNSYIDKQMFEKGFQNEIHALKAINCQNCVKYFTHFCRETDYYIVMELCDSDLKTYVEEEHKASFTIEEIREIFNQLNNVFKEMRKNNIMHRDLKLDNILIKKLENGQNIYKLGDFRDANLSIKAPEIS